MASQSANLAREMERLGRNIRAWRKISGLTTLITAERAGVSRDTLRAIETGRSTSSENLLAVMRVVGILAAVVDASDPIASDFGSRNLARASVERVRSPRPTLRTEGE
ncbi:helix-turn-helix domain-containing protein [Salinibacterium sp. SWN248]|uniref:helix-turn-helix domain-containing protein n=1 Tax=Salinibacterium sp. SWN248 TaxID=2792056 RepID=UPI0018CEAF6F|nr:helix-turn-helix transcriptional regulator [Salinibacterium sp. SWN248]MBH0022701.1 helix-turn-helix transcriptional regulator [Salinibacterium sp. SWN248]